MDRVKKEEDAKLEIHRAVTETKMELPYTEGLSAGFPSPAIDFIDLTIDLNRHVVRHPSSTFYGRVKGKSMVDYGIDDGDLLVIDKSLDPADGKIAVCYIDGEFTVKMFKLEKDGAWLIPGNKKYKPIRVTSDNDFMIWGIVTFVIKSL